MLCVHMWLHGLIKECCRNIVALVGVSKEVSQCWVSGAEDPVLWRCRVYRNSQQEPTTLNPKPKPYTVHAGKDSLGCAWFRIWGSGGFRKPDVRFLKRSPLEGCLIIWSIEEISGVF